MASYETQIGLLTDVMTLLEKYEQYDDDTVRRCLMYAIQANLHIMSVLEMFKFEMDTISVNQLMEIRRKSREDFIDYVSGLLKPGIKDAFYNEVLTLEDDEI